MYVVLDGIRDIEDRAIFSHTDKLSPPLPSIIDHILNALDVEFCRFCYFGVGDACV